MSDEKVNTTVTTEEYEKGRDQAMKLAWAVYGGVVIAATTLFISFVLNAFSEDAYFSRAIMTAAGALVGLSMIAFPFALHKWAVEKTHRGWTAALYYGEIVFIAANTFVSFVTLLSKNAGYAAPEWAVMYEPFSILAIIYTLVAWGTVFLKDPRHKSTVKGLRALQDFDDKVSDKLIEFVDSIEGREAIQRAAQGKIESMFDASKFSNAPKHFVGQNLNSDAAQARLDGPKNYDYLRPPYGDRQHPDLILARIPGASEILQEWRDYDNRRMDAVKSNGNGATDPTNRQR
jgi:hypothetical protein